MPKLKVSDHAVVRYLERTQGVDVQAIRNNISELLAGQRVEKAIEFGRGANRIGVRLGNGDRIVIRQNTIVTYIR